MSFNEDLKRRLQDPEFSRFYLEAKKKSDKIIQRTLHSKWQKLWRVYYRIMPAKFTGL